MDHGPSFDRLWLFDGYKQRGILSSNQSPAMENKPISLVKFEQINQLNARIPHFLDSPYKKKKLPQKPKNYYLINDKLSCVIFVIHFVVPGII
jgi:hypothetical protein